MTNEVITADAEKPVFEGATIEFPTRAFNVFNQSESFFDDAAIGRLKEIEGIKDEKEKDTQMTIFILRQASFLPTAPLAISFFDNVQYLRTMLGLEKSLEKSEEK
jgi:hypothetical protein